MQVHDNPRSLVPGDVISLHGAIDRLRSANASPLSRDVSHIGAEIEKETQKLQTIITSLREHMNEFSSAWRLPDDILLHIFQCPLHDRIDKITNAFNISQVCRRWRAIALGCSSLWDTISENDPVWVAPLILERHRSAPLDVAWDTDSVKAKSRITPLKKILGHLDSVKSLDIKLDTKELDELISLFIQGTPRLEKLIISHHHSLLDELDARSGGTFWTPSIKDPNVALFPASPSLRTVRLFGVQLIWPDYARLWSSLTTLEITYEIYQPRILLTLPDLLEMLSTLPRLESLTLKNTTGFFRTPSDPLEEVDVQRLLTDQNAHPISGGQPIQVPQLRILSIDVPDKSSLVEFLRRVKFSHYCSVELNIYEFRVNNPGWSSGLPAPSPINPNTLVQAAIAMTFRDRPLEWKSLTILEMREHGGADVTSLKVSLRAPSRSGPVDVVMYLGDLSLSGRTKAFRTLASSVGMDGLNSLVIGRMDAPPAAWLNLSNLFRNLRSLRVHTNLISLQSLIAAMELNGPSIFPNVEVITLDNFFVAHELQVRIKGILRRRRGELLKLKYFEFWALLDSDRPVNWVDCAEKLNIIVDLSIAKSAKSRERAHRLVNAFANSPGVEIKVINETV